MIIFGTTNSKETNIKNQNQSRPCRHFLFKEFLNRPGIVFIRKVFHFSSKPKVKTAKEELRSKMLYFAVLLPNS